MMELRHKTFVGPTIYWQGGTLNENREAIRAEAEAFANRIGLERVVSLSEHAMSFGPFSVVVWYRATPTELDSPVVQVSNTAIATRLKGGFVPVDAPVRGQNGASAGDAFRWLVWLMALLTGMVAAAAWFER
jgi:hypothetical protein